jgi:hypothetical protein
MITPHQLAEIIRRAHAIGERKENQIGGRDYPREWQGMIVAALEAFGAAQALPEPDGYRAAWLELMEFCNGLKEENFKLREALAPFAKPSIPPELPDSLWTHCSSYDYDMPDRTFEQLTAQGVELKSRKISLTLWIDGHPLSDFRRAACALALPSTQEKPLSICSRCGGAPNAS